MLHKEREYSWMEDGEPTQEEEDVATIDSILVEVATPHTLHLTPHTLHPAPYTLHLTPHTLHPRP